MRSASPGAVGRACSRPVTVRRSPWRHRPRPRPARPSPRLAGIGATSAPWPAATELATAVVAEAERQLVAGSLPENLGSTREAYLHLATARAHLARLRNRAEPDAWAEIANGWEALHVPYLAAKARWWEAATALVSRDRRPQARTALVAAWDLAVELPARPLLREIRRLAQRGRIVLPDLPASLAPRQAPTVIAVGPGRPADDIDGEAIAVGRVQMIPGFEPLPSEEDGTQLSLDATGRWPTELAGESSTAPGHRRSLGEPGSGRRS